MKTVSPVWIDIFKHKDMDNKGSIKMLLLPWFLIGLGFFELDMFQGFISVPCIVIGIVILIERRWPEKWNEASSNLKGDE